MAITFHTEELKFTLKNKLRVKSWIRQVIKSEKKEEGSLNFVFTSDAKILETNIQFLNHNTYTDIITFDDCEGNVISGDILISIERVTENALKFGVAFDHELYRVMIHGVLHLCGYKDKSKVDAALMRKKEDQALRKFDY